MPTNCPAEVTLVNEIKTAIKGLTPALTTIIPKVKDTDIYPRPIGNPFLRPSLNSSKKAI